MNITYLIRAALLALICMHTACQKSPEELRAEKAKADEAATKAEASAKREKFAFEQEERARQALRQPAPAAPNAKTRSDAPTPTQPALPDAVTNTASGSAALAPTPTPLPTTINLVMPTPPPTPAPIPVPSGPNSLIASKIDAALAAGSGVGDPRTGDRIPLDSVQPVSLRSQPVATPRWQHVTFEFGPGKGYHMRVYDARTVEEILADPNYRAEAQHRWALAENRRRSDDHRGHAQRSLPGTFQRAGW